MSFGGTVRRGRRGAGSSGARTEGPPGPGLPAGRGVPGVDSEETAEIDWERVAVFGTGIALGAVLGAGVAILFAPYSGEETRSAIVRHGARLAERGRGTWEDLRDELQWAARRGKRRVSRRVQRARWAAEDLVDNRRRPDRWRRKKVAPKAEVRPDPEIDEQDVQEIVDAICSTG